MSKQKTSPSKRKPQPKMCEDCGKYSADVPGRLCPGCDAYREHTA